jgi:hypothetical protein
MLLVFATLWLGACGASTVDVVLPPEASTSSGSSAICRGVIAGKVSAMTAIPQPTATVTLESEEIAGVVLRDGVRAFVLDSGDIEFDVSGVSEGATPLPSGSKVVATRRNAVEAAISRWATGWNITVIIAGLLAVSIALMIARSLVRGAVGLAKLAVACVVALGVAYLATPPLAPIVERHVYPLLESARGHAPVVPPAAAPTQPSSGASKSQADVDDLARSAADQVGEWGRRLADTLRDRPLPNPVYPTFFGLWLIVFLLATSMLRKATPSAD